jgi:hypothetical protein
MLGLPSVIRSAIAAGSLALLPLAGPAKDGAKRTSESPSIATSSTPTRSALPATRAPAVRRTAKKRAEGRYQGFDLSRYPGDQAMEVWKDASPYHWTGYYLAAPCHHDASWMGRRESLARMGWGMAVVYVGQQDWPRTFHGGAAGRKPKRRAGLQCATGLVGAAEGAHDADHAVALTEGEGFPRGTTIYLDVERFHTLSPAMEGYVRAWVDRVLADGRYQPALYGHASNARSLYRVAQAAYTARGVEGRPAFWLSTAAGFSRSAHPTQVGYAFADVWQGKYESPETWGGTTLRVDASVSTTDSPSGSPAEAGTLADAPAR